MNIPRLAAVALAALPLRATAETPAVQAQLLCDASSLLPGTSCWVAVRLELSAGWHIYWKNPGENGLAPTVAWRLPAGYRVDPLQWPVPRRFGEAPSISYGLEGEVILLAQLHVPEAAAAPESIGARVTWLACREQCVPGQATLALRPLASAEAAPLLARARARLPAPAPPGLRVRATAGGYAIALGAAQAAASYFFCADPAQVDASAAQAWRAGAAELAVPASPYRRGPTPRLRGVLRVDSPAPAYWSLDLPVQQSAEQGDTR